MQQVLLEEYKLLAGFHHYEGTIFWQRHALYLAVNAALVAALALAVPKDPGALIGGSIAPPVFLAAVSLTGTAVCLVWLATTLSGGWWCKAWDTMMRRIEDGQDLSLPTQFMNRTTGSRWSEVFDKARWPSVKVASCALPVVFGLQWVAALLWLVWTRVIN